MGKKDKPIFFSHNPLKRKMNLRKKMDIRKRKE